MINDDFGHRDDEHNATLTPAPNKNERDAFLRGAKNGEFDAAGHTPKMTTDMTVIEELVEFQLLLNESSFGSPTARAGADLILDQQLTEVNNNLGTDARIIEAELLAADRLFTAGDADAARRLLRGVLAATPTTETWSLQTRAAARLTAEQHLGHGKAHKPGRARSWASPLPEHQEHPITGVASATSGAIPYSRPQASVISGAQGLSSAQLSLTDTMVVDSMPTAELLRIAVGGAPAAWEAIVRRFEPAVAAMITTYRLQEADARDATQRTWLRMLENHQQIREPEALGGWLKTTARRECLRILAEQRRIEPLPETTEFPDGATDVEGSVVDAEQARFLRSVLAMLPARSYTLIRTLFQDEPPCNAELSAATGIPVGSIGPTRARALRRLRRMFEEGAGSA